jgi:hypothetical protein
VTSGASYSAMGSPRGLQHHLRGYLYSNPLAYVYTSVYSMVFTWDPRKSHANLEVVRRIISARRSNKREREAYQKAFEAGDPQSGTGRPASPSGND